MSAPEPYKDELSGKMMFPIHDPVEDTYTWVPEDMLISNDTHQHNGKVADEYTRNLMSESRKQAHAEGLYGDVGQRMKKAHVSGVYNAANAKQVTCPHCVKTGLKRSMVKFHFDNCKELTGEIVKKPKIKCPHCDKEGAPHLMKRYHFDNCKVLACNVKNLTEQKAIMETCPHCGKIAKPHIIRLWHGDNCKTVKPKESTPGSSRGISG